MKELREKAKDLSSRLNQCIGALSVENSEESKVLKSIIDTISKDFNEIINGYESIQPQATVTDESKRPDLDDYKDEIHHPNGSIEDRWNHNDFMNDLHKYIDELENKLQQPQTTVTDESNLLIKLKHERLLLQDERSKNGWTKKEAERHELIDIRINKLQQPQEQKDSECCEHVKYNPFNKVVQCHKCGEIKEQKDSECCEHVKYNPFNKVVQCHKCGEIKEQKDSELIEQSQIENVLNNSKKIIAQRDKMIKQLEARIKEQDIYIDKLKTVSN